MRLFVDTGAWFALNSRSDTNHHAAARFIRRFRSEPVILYTTDCVVDETATLLRFKVSHRQAVSFLNLLSESPIVVRETIDVTLLHKAERLFRKYRDKRWSYTDCVSFVLMDRAGVAQEIFICLAAPRCE